MNRIVHHSRTVQVLALTLVLMVGVPAHARLAGIAGYAGNLGAGCDSCHDGGTVPVVRLSGPTRLTAGQQATYRFTIESGSPDQTVAGFDVAASAGILESLAGQGSRAAFGEVLHSAPKPASGGETSWDFIFRAPNQIGAQTIYASGLSADDNEMNDGDASAVTTLGVDVVAPPCLGDCDGDGAVRVSELIRGARIGLRTLELDVCPVFDRNGDGEVSIDELVAAVQNALLGCGHEFFPTITPTGAPTPTAAPSGTPIPCSTEAPTPDGAAPIEWTTYGHNQSRTFYNADERRISRETVGSLRPKWRYMTAAIITASPAVAYVEVPGEGRIKVVIAPSWDGNVYALRASNGTKLWSFRMKPHPGGSFPYAASAAVATVDGEQRVYVPGGMTLYCLEAATGDLRWEFDAGTGCTDCDRRAERNEILSSPALADGKVFFGMDVNEGTPGKGGAFAVDAADGSLTWYFDLETQATCRPDDEDEIRGFDGFHSAEELGLPEDFFATRAGCDFDRATTACGNIWSSFAVDETRGAIFAASSNCYTDDDPETVAPAPPMPPFDEAIFSLDFDGVPRWRWRPREVDNDDLAFGGAPNLFTITAGEVQREVVGVGGKDGVYYVLDRDGVNQDTGTIEPYWQTRVVPGGAIGGIIATAAVGEGKILFSTAIGDDLANPQLPAAWALDANTGEILWSSDKAQPSYAPASAVPGLVFLGSLFAGKMFAYDTDTGEQLYGSPSLFGPAASAPAIVDGEVFVGGGVGQRGNPSDIAHIQSLFPSPISAFCLPSDCECPTELCDDGDPCTFDYHDDGDSCATEPAPDGIGCRTGPSQGTCVAGKCEP